jgi:hypothetical protein
MSAYTDAVAALPGVMGHWSMETGLPNQISGGLALPALMTVGASPGTLGSASIIPGDPTGKATAGKTVDGSDVGHVNDSVLLDNVLGITFGAWVIPSQASDHAIISKSGAYSAYVTGSQYQGNVLNASVVQAQATSPAHRMVPGNLAFVVVTYDGILVRTYVDGEVVASTSLSGSVLNNAEELRIGASEFLGTVIAGFKGSMQSPFICNQPISTNQIRNLYEIGGATLAEQAGLSKQVFQWSRLVAPANANRTRINFWNDSDAVIYLALDQDAVQNGGPRLAPHGGSWYTESHTGAIYAVCQNFGTLVPMGGKTLTLHEEE